MLKDVYSYLLSENLLDYLPVSQVEDSMTRINTSLKEKNNMNNLLVKIKSFYNSVLVKDFPVKGRSLLLNLSRGRWINKETGEYVSLDLGLVSQGKRITAEIAAFLKGLDQ